MTSTAPVQPGLPDYLRNAARQALESDHTDAALELLQMLKRHQLMQNGTKLIVATKLVCESETDDASAVDLLNATGKAQLTEEEPGWCFGSDDDDDPYDGGIKAAAAHSVAYWRSYVMVEFRLPKRQIRGEYSFTVYELQKNILQQFNGSNHGYYLTQGDTAMLPGGRICWKDRLTDALLDLKHAGKLSAAPRCKTYQFCD